ncbi:MAG: type II toxin-antitoxin system RelE/ParE family toxin [Terracidiphilus sp.]
MTYRVAFTRGAQADLHSLFDYLAHRFSFPNAQRYVEQIEKTCLSLGIMPNRGTERSDLRPGLRTMGFRRRVTIAFRVKEDSVTILRILYGGRSAESALEDEEE